MSYSKTYDRHNNSYAHLNTTGTMIDRRYINQAGVLRLYAAGNVVAYLTGIKGYGVSTDQDLNTTFSAHNDENKTYKFDVLEFHYAVFEGEKVYITQSGREYEQKEADRHAAEYAKAKAEAIQQENEYKIKKYDSVARRLAEAENYRMINENYKEVLDRVLDIISADAKIEFNHLFGHSPEVRAALNKNKKKYQRRYK